LAEARQHSAVRTSMLRATDDALVWRWTGVLSPQTASAPRKGHCMLPRRAPRGPALRATAAAAD